MEEHQDAVDKASGFIGREVELARFAEALSLLHNNAEEKPFPRIFVIKGEGGIGKSELLRQFEHIGSSAKQYALFMKVDCGEDEARALRDPQAVMRALYAQAKTKDCEGCFEDYARNHRKFRDLNERVWRGKRESYCRFPGSAQTQPNFRRGIQ